LATTPNPKSPIPNPQSPFLLNLIIKNEKILKIKIYKLNIISNLL